MVDGGHRSLYLLTTYLGAELAATRATLRLCLCLCVVCVVCVLCVKVGGGGDGMDSQVGTRHCPGGGWIIQELRQFAQAKIPTKLPPPSKASSFFFLAVALALALAH
jgi:hypothetical protein